MRLPNNLKPGDLVQIEFLDHCEDGDDAMRFYVWGRISRITRHAVTVTCWDFVNPEDAHTAAAGTIKSFSIVKTAMQKLTVLAPRS